MYNCMKLVHWIILAGDKPLKELAAIENIATAAMSDRETIAAVSACDETVLSMSSSIFTVQVSSVASVPPVHSQPFSTSHTSLQPSAVFELPSSHCSPMSLCPFAQDIITTNY